MDPKGNGRSCSKFLEGDSPGAMGRWKSCCWNFWRDPRSFLQESQTSRAMGWALSQIPEAGNGAGSLWSLRILLEQLPGTSGTANPGEFGLFPWFWAQIPSSPLQILKLLLHSLGIPGRSFQQGWEFWRSLFPPVFQGIQGIAASCWIWGFLGAARTSRDHPNPGIPVDFNGKIPLAELLCHHRCYKSHLPSSSSWDLEEKNKKTHNP